MHSTLKSLMEKEEMKTRVKVIKSMD